MDADTWLLGLSESQYFSQLPLARETRKKLRRFALQLYFAGDVKRYR